MLKRSILVAGNGHCPGPVLVEEKRPEHYDK